MFDFVHEKKKIVQIVLAIILLPFALWGVSSYERAGNSVQAVATVNGAKITEQEFENALRQQQNVMRERLGANYDAAMFDSPEAKHAIIDNLVTQRLLVEKAKADGLVVTDDQLAQTIGSVDAFQVDGKFDKSRYMAVLASNNLSPPVYEARLRAELLRQRLQEAYTQNGFAPGSVAENIFHLSTQQRVVSVSRVSFREFMARAKVDDADLKKYYEQHRSEFQVREQARVEYVKLSVDNLVAKADVSDEEARSYYDEHKNDFGAPEERQASHILITVTPAASQAERDAARTKAESLLKQVKQNPARFAELAKQNSQDPGSAAKGGDLGFFGRGMMVKPFEDAAFSLKVGEISGLVQSDFGYHIIRLTAIKPSKVIPFDKARAGVMARIRQQKAADMFAELAEKFSNTVYEQSDTLKPAAALAGSKIEQSGWLVDGSVQGEPWTAKMLQAIFTDDVVKNKRNSAATEVAPNVLVAARILEYKPAAVSEFGEVKEAIRQRLAHEKALELAASQGKALLEQLQKGGKPALKWDAAQSITRMQHGSLDTGLVRQIFQANAAGLPQYAGAEDAQNGYILVRIDAVKEGEPINDSVRARYAQQLRQLTGEEMFQAYLADAKQQATVKVNLPGKAPEQ